MVPTANTRSRVTTGEDCPRNAMGLPPTSFDATHEGDERARVPPLEIDERSEVEARCVQTERGSEASWAEAFAHSASAAAADVGARSGDQTARHTDRQSLFHQRGESAGATDLLTPTPGGS
jgi:hypothetical protein